MTRHRNTPLVRTGLMSLGFLTLVLLWHPGNARAACQVQYTGKAAQMFGSAPRGNFRTLADCNKYIKNSAGFERANSHCVGSCGNTSGGASGSSGLKPGQALALGIIGAALESALSQPAGPSPEEIARKQAEEEAARQEAQRRAEEEARRLAEAKERRLMMAQNMKPLGSASTPAGSAATGQLAWKGIDVDMTPPTAASAITPGSGTNAARISMFSRLSCAQSLSDAASQYADMHGRDAAEKTRFYAEQARKALAGERLEVECPAAGALPPVPEPTGIERVYPGEGTIKELKQKAKADLGTLEAVRAKKRDLSERKAVVEAKKKETEEKISKSAESDPAVDTLKAEAEALLRESEAELAEITKDAKGLEKEEARLNDNLKRYQTAASKLEAK